MLAPSIAADVTTAMAGVPAYVRQRLAGGRPAAAKTGTVQRPGPGEDNKDAWMVGFTPQLATVVWVGTDASAPIRDARGRPVSGGTLPAAMWKRVMDAGLTGQPILRLTAAPAPVRRP